MKLYGRNRMGQTMTEMERMKAIRNGLKIQVKELEHATRLLQILEEELGGVSEDISWTILHHAVTIARLNEKIQQLEDMIGRMEAYGWDSLRNAEPVRVCGMRA